MKSRSTYTQRRPGAVALEFALVAIFLVIAVLGIVEVSTFIKSRQMVVNAARDAVRAAVKPGADYDDLMQLLTTYVQGTHMGSATYTPVVLVNGTEVTDQDSWKTETEANSNATITVRLSAPFSDFYWPTIFIPNSSSVSAEVIMRKE